MAQGPLFEQLSNIIQNSNQNGVINQQATNLQTQFANTNNLQDEVKLLIQKKDLLNQIVNLLNISQQQNFMSSLIQGAKDGTIALKDMLAVVDNSILKNNFEETNQALHSFNNTIQQTKSQFNQFARDIKDLVSNNEDFKNSNQDVINQINELQSSLKNMSNIDTSGFQNWAEQWRNSFDEINKSLKDTDINVQDLNETINNSSSTIVSGYEQAATKVISFNANMQQAFKNLKKDINDNAKELYDFAQQAQSLSAKQLSLEFKTNSEETNKDIQSILNSLKQFNEQYLDNLQKVNDVEPLSKLDAQFQTSIEHLNEVVEKTKNFSQQNDNNLNNLSGIISIDKFMESTLSVKTAKQNYQDILNIKADVIREQIMSTKQQIDDVYNDDSYNSQQKQELLTSLRNRRKGLIEDLKDVKNEFSDFYTSLNQASNTEFEQYKKNIAGTDIRNVNLNMLNGPASNLGQVFNLLQSKAIKSGDNELFQIATEANDLSKFITNGDIQKQLNNLINTGNTKDLQQLLFNQDKIDDNNILSQILNRVDEVANEDIKKLAENKDSDEGKLAQSVLNSAADISTQLAGIATIIQQQFLKEGKTEQAETLQPLIDNINSKVQDFNANNSAAELLKIQQESEKTQEKYRQELAGTIDKAVSLLGNINTALVNMPNAVLGDGVAGTLFNRNVQNMMSDPLSMYKQVGLQNISANEMQAKAIDFARQEESNIYDLSKLANTYNLDLDVENIVRTQSNKLYEESGGKIDFNELSKNYQAAAQMGMLNNNEVSNIANYSTITGEARADINAGQITSSIQALHRQLGLTGDESVQVFDRMTQAADNSGIGVNEFAGVVSSLSDNFRILGANGQDMSNIMDVFGNVLSNTNITMNELTSLTTQLSDSFRFMGGNASDVANAVNNFAALQQITGIAMKDIQSMASSTSENFRFLGADTEQVTDYILKLGVASKQLDMPLKDLEGLFNANADKMRLMGASAEDAVNATIKIAESANNSKFSVKDYQSAFTNVIDEVRMMGGSSDNAVDVMNKISAIAENGIEPLGNYTSAYSSLNSQFRSLGITGSTAVDMLGNMAIMAARTGTPIANYASAISSLATSYSDMGASAEDAFNVYNNLLDMGFSPHLAQTTASNFGSGLSKFSHDEGQVIMSNILQGNGDIFGSLFNSQYRDENWAGRTAQQMDTMLRFNRSIFGNNSLGDWQTLKQLQGMGFTEKQATEIFDKLRNGEINGLSDLLNNNEYLTTDDATIDTNKTVNKIEKEVEQIKDSLVGESGIDKSTEAAIKSNENTLIQQQQNVGILQEMQTQILSGAKSLTTNVEEFSNKLNEFLDDAIQSSQLNVEANYNQMNNALESMFGEFIMSHPNLVASVGSIQTMMATLLGYLGLNSLGSIVSSVGGRFISGTGLPSTLGGGASAAGAGAGGAAAGAGAAGAATITAGAALKAGAGGAAIGVAGHQVTNMIDDWLHQEGIESDAYYNKRKENDGIIRNAGGAIMGGLGAVSGLVLSGGNPAGAAAGAAIATAGYESSVAQGDKFFTELEKLTGLIDEKGRLKVSGQWSKDNDIHDDTFDYEKVFDKNKNLFGLLGINSVSDLQNTNLSFVNNTNKSGSELREGLQIEDGKAILWKRNERGEVIKQAESFLDKDQSLNLGDIQTDYQHYQRAQVELNSGVGDGLIHLESSQLELDNMRKAKEDEILNIAHEWSRNGIGLDIMGYHAKSKEEFLNQVKDNKDYQEFKKNIQDNRQAMGQEEMTDEELRKAWYYHLEKMDGKDLYETDTFRKEYEKRYGESVDVVTDKIEAQTEIQTKHIEALKNDTDVNNLLRQYTDSNTEATKLLTNAIDLLNTQGVKLQQGSVSTNDINTAISQSYILNQTSSHISTEEDKAVDNILKGLTGKIGDQTAMAALKQAGYTYSDKKDIDLDTTKWTGDILFENEFSATFKNKRFNSQQDIKQDNMKNYLGEVSMRDATFDNKTNTISYTNGDEITLDEASYNLIKTKWDEYQNNRKVNDLQSLVNTTNDMKVGDRIALSNLQKNAEGNFINKYSLGATIGENDKVYFTKYQESKAVDNWQGNLADLNQLLENNAEFDDVTYAIQELTKAVDDNTDATGDDAAAAREAASAKQEPSDNPSANDLGGVLGGGQLLLDNDVLYGSSYFGNSDATTDWDSIKQSIRSAGPGIQIPYDSQGLSIATRMQTLNAAYNGNIPDNLNVGRSNININYVVRDKEEIDKAQEYATALAQTKDDILEQQIIYGAING